MNYSVLMMGKYRVLLLSILLTFVPAFSDAEPLDVVDDKSRCPVCGMFVAKYDVWITQIHYDDKLVHSFDGVKDMMAYYFDPASFNGQPQDKIREIWVKDYYSLKWIDARKAFFVTGSDVHGPMGHEFIPFSSRAAADSFKSDHSGEKLLSFDEITHEMVDLMRVGNKMKHNKK